jgi:hypothetical protein
LYKWLPALSRQLRTLLNGQRSEQVSQIKRVALTSVSSASVTS